MQHSQGGLGSNFLSSSGSVLAYTGLFLIAEGSFDFIKFVLTSVEGAEHP